MPTLAEYRNGILDDIVCKDCQHSSMRVDNGLHASIEGYHLSFFCLRRSAETCDIFVDDGGTNHCLKYPVACEGYAQIGGEQ